MYDELKVEVAHCRFVDIWKGIVPRKDEKHLQIEIATDASLFRWGAVVDHTETLGDFFPQGDVRPIHIKEADVLYRTIHSREGKPDNHRVDVRVKLTIRLS